uniref:Uncharacterized protein n=1 Tax=Otus sunia TaxID=257818 RepID=A0A8C8AD06_9STRI
MVPWGGPGGGCECWGVSVAAVPAGLGPPGGPWGGWAPCPPGTDPVAPGTAPGGWGGVGLCPLNLFLVPLRLLARAGPSG